MTSSLFLELGVSVALQVALLVALTHCLAQFLAQASSQYRLWTVSFLVQLLLLLAAVLLPHLRLLQSFLPESLPKAEVASLQVLLGTSLFWVWLSGVAFSWLVLVYRIAQVGRFLRTCSPWEPLDLPEQAAQVLTNYRPQNSGGKIRLLASDTTAIPFCWQFHRPYVVLPRYLLQIPAEQLQAILRHELEHLRSGHPLQLFLQRVVETVFWFHPFVWWGSRQAAILREFSCDDAAIRHDTDLAGYLAAMLSVAEQGLKSKQDHLPVTLSFTQQPSLIALRTERLVKKIRNSPSVRRMLSPRWVLGGLMIGSALIQAVWLPIDVLASRRSPVSPWPRWTAAVLHDFGIVVRDFEVFDQRCEIYELREVEQMVNSAPQK